MSARSVRESRASAVTFVDVTGLRGTRRGHRIPEAEKQRIVDETRQPGQTVRGVARQHGIARETLYRWRREREHAPAAWDDQETSRTIQDAARTVELAVADTVVRVPADIPQGQLANILAAVRGGS